MTEHDLNRKWYAVSTRHQHERSAARILEYKQFEVFLPLYTALRRWQDRIKELSVPLFPGYLFVREEPERMLPVLTTPGVCCIVSYGGRPAAVPFSEIEDVRRIVQSALRVEPHPFLKCGDWVRVKYGPIAGVEGILLRNLNLRNNLIPARTSPSTHFARREQTPARTVLGRAPCYEAFQTYGQIIKCGFCVFGRSAGQ